MTFKKGNIPWNKNKNTGLAPWEGKHRDQETKEKISIKLIGNIPWNKGKTNIYSKETIEKMRNHKLNNPSETGFQKGHIPWITGKYHSEIVKIKIRNSRLAIRDKISGENHPNWKGGLSSETQKRLNGWEWANMAKIIRKRDNHICQSCGKKPSYEVHHIIPYRIIQNNNPENLITLCKSCHKKIEHTVDKLIIFLLVLAIAEQCGFIPKEKV